MRRVKESKDCIGRIIYHQGTVWCNTTYWNGFGFVDDIYDARLYEDADEMPRKIEGNEFDGIEFVGPVDIFRVLSLEGLYSVRFHYENGFTRVVRGSK